MSKSNGPMKSFALGVVVASTALACAIGPTRAQPLSLNTCLALWRGVNGAGSDDVAALAIKDPGALGASLTKEKMKSVKQYLDRVEKLKFRCRNFMPPPPGASQP